MDHSVERGHRCIVEARGLSRSDINDGSLLLRCLFFLDCVDGLDVFFDGCVVIGSSNHILIAFSTITRTILWRKVMSAEVWALRIHGGVVAVPVRSSNTEILDVSSGHQIHVLPTAWDIMCGVYVRDG